MARIIPTDHEPGAREARTISFVDRYLSGIDFIYAKPDGSGFETLEGKRADAWRQRVDILRKTYVKGSLPQRTRPRKIRLSLHALDEKRQDEALHALERQEAQARGVQDEGPALQQTLTETELSFVPLLAMHTRQGFYADPISLRRKQGPRRMESDRLSRAVVADGGFHRPIQRAAMVRGRRRTEIPGGESWRVSQSLCALKPASALAHPASLSLRC